MFIYCKIVSYLGVFIVSQKFATLSTDGVFKKLQHILHNQKYIRSARQFRSTWKRKPYPLMRAPKRSFVGRHITIIHQILHHLLCHIHSFHLSSPTRDQQGVCHDIGRTRLFLFICLNKSIARSMFFNSIQPCMSVV